jgi:hypothetical protein
VAGLWVALRVHATGRLDPVGIRHLIDSLGLVDVPRVEGPGAAASIAHREVPFDGTRRLMVDLSRIGAEGWVATVFFEGEPPGEDLLEPFRQRALGLVGQLGLRLVEVDPARTPDEVFAAPAATALEFPAGARWDLPCQTLDQLFWHLDVGPAAPLEVARVKLAQLTRQPVWTAAPAGLRAAAERFLAEPEGDSR